MSDRKSEELIDDVKSAVELAPIIEGVTAIAESVVKTEQRVEKQIEANQKSVLKQLDEHKDDTASGFTNVIDRIDRLAKAQTRASGGGGRIAACDSLDMSTLPKSYRQRMGEFEAAAANLPKSAGVLREPKVYAKATEWFCNSTDLQRREKAADHSRIHEKQAALVREMDGVVGKASLQEDAAAEGGNLVPTLVAGSIDRLINDAAILWPRCRQVALQTKTTNFPAENTAVTVNWIEEESALTQGEPTFAQISIVAEKLAGRAKFSVELMQDSAPMLLQYLLSVFTEKMAGELDYQLVVGAGTSPQLTGITNASNLVQDTLSTQASLTWSRLVNGFVAAGETTARADGVWICSPKGYAQIIGLQADAVSGGDSAGMPMIQYGATTQDAPAGTLLGRPILVSNRFGGSATLDNTTLTKTQILFGPPSAIVAGTRQGMAWDVTDAVGWANYQMDARLVGRFGASPVVGSAWVSIENISY